MLCRKWRLDGRQCLQLTVVKGWARPWVPQFTARVLRRVSGGGIGVLRPDALLKTRATHERLLLHDIIQHTLTSTPLANVFGLWVRHALGKQQGALDTALPTPPRCAVQLQLRYTMAPRCCLGVAPHPRRPVTRCCDESGAVRRPRAREKQT